MTWQLIGEIAEGAGQAYPEPWGGRSWADEALKSKAPAEQRSLYELLWYLDQEGYAVVSPVAVEHIESLKHAEDTYDVVLTLLGRAADEMISLVPTENPRPMGSAGTSRTSRSQWARGPSASMERSNC